jgi:putative transposase
VPKKRHTPYEIAAKLQHADRMKEQGKLQQEIARALNVSMMTYHRWRKASHPPAAGPDRLSVGISSAPSEPRPGTMVGAVRTAQLDPGEASLRIRELQLENSRLRDLVADLLLEKVKLEESLRGEDPFRRSRR